MLPGFHPDPSIVRVGDDYFLATSTFVWQPGIRLFHSTDLTHWVLAGHALDGAHDLRGLDANGGVWAPNLSFDPETSLFHLVYSLVTSTAAGYFDVNNHVVTAPAITGPWSAPSYLNSVGFDPSLFHDDDGTHWLVTLEWDPREGYEHPGAIVLEEYDAQRRRIAGPTRQIFRGSTDRGCLEGPLMFKRDGYYYLLAAEGGTGFGHGATLARARDRAGPFTPAPVNPFLTSSPAPHYGRNDTDHLRPGLDNPAAELQKAGHASLVETPAGEWYAAHLCARPIGPDRRCVLGRETALQQVEWTPDGWLQLSAGGVLPRLTTPSPQTPSPQTPSPRTAADQPDDHVVTDRTAAGAPDLRDDFDQARLHLGLSSLRRRVSPDWAGITPGTGVLSLRGGEALTSRFDVSVIATQVQGMAVAAETMVDVEPRHFSHSAGLTVFYDNDNFIYARVYRSQSLGSRVAGIVQVRSGIKSEFLLHRAVVGEGSVRLRAAIDHGTLQLSWRPAEDDEWRSLGPAMDATFMSDEATRGFMGTMVGMACVDSYRRDLWASFSYFEVRPLVPAPVPGPVPDPVSALTRTGTP